MIYTIVDNKDQYVHIDNKEGTFKITPCDEGACMTSLEYLQARNDIEWILDMVKDGKAVLEGIETPLKVKSIGGWI